MTVMVTKELAAAVIAAIPFAVGVPGGKRNSRFNVFGLYLLTYLCLRYLLLQLKRNSNLLHFFITSFSGFIMPEIVDNSTVVSHEEVPDLPEKEEIN